MSLELYAKVEPLLGIDEATAELHSYYIDLVREYEPRTLLDVGCGRGAFLQACKEEGVACVGIDLSQTMVDAACSVGLTAAVQDIKDMVGAFDMVTAIFDVLNFLDREALKEFLYHVDRLLNPGGYFVADINTRYGFEEVAVGTLTYTDEEKSLIVDATFEEDRLTTQFVYFELADAQKKLFSKEQDTIVQYFYEIESLLDLTGLELNIEMPIELYGEEADKSILLFHKPV